MENEQEKTLFCGNIPPNVTEDLLFELFVQAGPVTKVTLPKDKEGKIRSYGFVLFKHAVSVKYAIELLSGVSLYGRMLHLKTRGLSTDGNPNQRSQSIGSFQPNLNQNQYQHNSNMDRDLYSPQANGHKRHSSDDDHRDDEDLHKEKKYRSDRNRHKNQYKNQHRSMSNQADRFSPMVPPIPPHLISNSGHFSYNGPTVDRASIFDPTIEQKMNEKLMLLQQRDPRFGFFTLNSSSYNPSWQVQPPNQNCWWR